MSFRQTQITSDELLNSTYKDLLTGHLGENIDFDKDLNLSKKQKEAYESFKAGKNLLILGPAGTGKSKIIKTMEEYIKKEKKDLTIVLSATTGISAYNIGGMTVYSFLGMGTGEGNVDYLVKKIARRKFQAEKIRNTDILVIDEISMMSAEIFEKIEEICRKIRRKNTYFGGIQVVLTGDLLQLLPVFKQNTLSHGSPGEKKDERMIIESKLFQEIYKNDNVVILDENFRQKQDVKYSEILNRIRLGEYTEGDVEVLNMRKIKKDVLEPKKDTIQLVSSNKKAKEINEKHLNKDGCLYKAKYITKGTDEDIKNMLLKELQTQFRQKETDEVVLCRNNRVMLTKNKDVKRGLVNGSIGTITRFVKNTTTGEAQPEVLFDNGEKTVITKEEWEIDLNGNSVIVEQIPLILAYSITIHKSQSLTLDSAVLDLEDCFTYHMVYVSLSRIKTLDGLYIKSFDPKKILVNEKMKLFNKKMKK